MPHTLLLADDSVTIQRVIELTFADEDIKVVAVSDGDQAIARLQAAAPDIVLADIGMPGKNGYEVAQYVRQTPTLSHIPVVLLTGAFEPVDQARAAEAGCDGVLAKPFEPQQVIGRVRELLAKGHNSSSASRADTVIVPPPAAAQPDAAAAAASAGLDDYLDRLDASFSGGFPDKDTKAVSGTPELPTPPEAGAAPQAPVEIDWFGGGFADQDTKAEAVDLFKDAKAEAAETPATPFAIELDHHPAATASVPAVIEETAPEPVAAPAPIAIAPRVEPDATPHAGVGSEPAEPFVPSVSSAPSFVSSRPSEESAFVSVSRDATRLPSLGDAFAALLAAEQGGASSAAEWPGTGSTAAAAQAIKDSLVDDVVQRVLQRMSDAVVRDVTATLVSEIAERLVREEIERIKAAVK